MICVSLTSFSNKRPGDRFYVQMGIKIGDLAAVIYKNKME